MQLEDRVKVLEDEIKILKNEIQSTLLDIQEQVLIHYYPSLRAEGASPSEDTIESLQPILSERRKGESETSAPPMTRESSLEGIMHSLESISEERKEVPENALTPPEEQPSSRAEKVGRPPFTELAGWVSDSVERIGRERTREAIEIYARGGYLAPEVKDILLQLISLSDEEGPPEKVGMEEMLDIFVKLDKVLGYRKAI
jgi:hypothetical protein